MKSNRVVRALCFSSGVSFMLFMIRALSLKSTNYWYLNWNLLLAWIPLLFAVLVVKHLRTGPWISWRGILLTALWLAFLPNSFYIATDFIHLQRNSVDSLLLDIVMLLAFTFNGFILGYLSIYTIHKLLLKRVKTMTAHTIIALVFLACSFAIYLGRYLRWNTWDIVINPAGLLFDVSDRFINPAAHVQTFLTTALFFVLIGAFYVVAWQAMLELKAVVVSKTRHR